MNHGFPISMRSLSRWVASTATCMTLIMLTAPTAGAATDCSRRLNDAAKGSTLDPPVTLTPTPQSAQRQLNFDTDRDPKTIRGLTVTADRALPAEFTPEQVNYDALIARTGDSLESTDFPDPTFTNPRISPDQKSMTFDVCLDPRGIPAGKYVGSVGVSGPVGLGAASINLSVNAKNDGLFWVGLIMALGISFALLLLKDAAAVFPPTGGRWSKVLLVPLKDLRWWAATLIALGSAFGILYAAYANDPAWGATGLTAVASLVGSAFAAIGGQSILTSFKSS
jgi:hypothetical protein